VGLKLTEHVEHISLALPSHLHFLAYGPLTDFSRKALRRADIVEGSGWKMHRRPPNPLGQTHGNDLCNDLDC
jgi:hypothetical protein